MTEMNTSSSYPVNVKGSIGPQLNSSAHQIGQSNGNNPMAYPNNATPASTQASQNIFQQAFSSAIQSATTAAVSSAFSQAFQDNSSQSNNMNMNMNTNHTSINTLPDGNVGIPPNRPAQISHIIFKLVALFIYLFSSLFNIGFVMLFVTMVLLSAFDFWTVKNVTGRLLVGLRWWNQVKEDGSTIWIYESQPSSGARPIHSQDSLIFWTTIYITPVIWLLLCISSLLSKYLIIVAVPLVLSVANLIGYWKCQSDAKQKLASFLMNRL